MNDSAAVSIAIICEADADRRTACNLADRVLCSQVEWIDSDDLDNYRMWRGLNRADSYLKLDQVWSLAEERDIEALGHFNGEPGAADARVARAAFLLLVSSDFPPHAVVLVRDSDNELERRRGCEQARQFRDWETPIAIGIAHTKRECWILAGYDPRDKAEEKALKKHRQRLGFDPRLQSEKLTAKHDTDIKSAKRILTELVNDEFACWQQSDLELLEQRGLKNGLAEFIGEIKSRLIPLFTGRPK